MSAFLGPSLAFKGIIFIVNKSVVDSKLLSGLDVPNCHKGYFSMHTAVWITRVIVIKLNRFFLFSGNGTQKKSSEFGSQLLITPDENNSSLERICPPLMQTISPACMNSFANKPLLSMELPRTSTFLLNTDFIAVYSYSSVGTSCSRQLIPPPPNNGSAQYNCS